MNNISINASYDSYAQYQVHKVVGKKYHILVKVLGQGQYARTFLARNVVNGKYIACKVISKESIVQYLNQIDNQSVAHERKAKIMQRLQSEVDNTGKMQHDNIVKLEDLVESSNNIYLFMEFCAGGTLEKVLQNRKKISEQEALPLFRQLTEGCVYLYEKSVIHRDLKPSNILFYDQEQKHFKIADFGLSKAIRDEIKDMETSLTPWIGTPLYMSPQVIGQEPYSIKADVWSLGCIFYEILFGKTPWYSDKVHILQQMILEGNLTFPNEPQVSSQIKELIKGMLIKDENSRFNILQVYQALR